MSLSETLAAFAATTDVPTPVIEKARAAMIDTVGCALAGADADSTQILSRVVARQDNGGPCTVIGSRRTANARDAALINGTAAHALDFDDINWSLYGHPSVAILPTAMALAEAEGASGDALLSAFAIGVEVACKIGRFANPALYEHGWHATSAVGALGAAAAGGRLLKLDPGRMSMAIGIAASMASGLRRNFGSMTKPFHAGRAAEVGVLAAQLAQEGFTADAEALEGKAGYFQVLNARSTPSAGDLAAVLGKPWDLVDPGIVVKVYPACGATHCAIDGVLDLKQRHGWRPDEVEEIRIGADPLALKILQHPRPRTGLEGKFSMHFCLAVAAVDGAPSLHHFADDWLARADVQDLIGRVTIEDRSGLGGPDTDGVPASVEVRLKNGSRFEQTVLVPRGHPRNPISAAELEAKFLSCAAPALGDRSRDAYRTLSTLSSKPVSEARRALTP